MGQGCLVQETKSNSFRSGFAQAGGGVFATQLDASGIYMWFCSRSSLPASILQADSASHEPDGLGYTYRFVSR
ncbi:hypothetical protein C8J55DRAFT_122507 [Lentinula edodes]|uniref:Uncharacterized protein n=1 Tax=Lentinula lateritia TaxID=40482 RepID=A0A9W9A9M0_9AGAR|nr:hypothetical protein C8J55DRAFT_122507 [Lentinula edodes]